MRTRRGTTSAGTDTGSGTGTGTGTDTDTGTDTRTVDAAIVPTRSRSPNAEAGLWRTFGPLAPYLLHGDVTDLFVTAGGELWADGGPRGLRRIDGWRSDERATRDLAVRLIAGGGRHIDEATPFVDVRVLDGIRVHAVLPPISTGGTLLSVRIPSRRVLRLPDLVAGRAVTPAQADALLLAIAARTNLLITGAGGSGNTTRNL